VPCITFYRVFCIMIGIYKITNPNNRIYIGQSINIERRFIEYKKPIKSQPKLYNSLLKHGVENHTFEIIENCNVELLNERERYWQDFYNVLSKNGMNCVLTKSTDKIGFFSIETRLKMSISNKKRIRSEEEKNMLKTKMLGRKHTKETKLKMSVSGKNKSPETLLKMSIASRNMPKTSRIEAGKKMIGNKNSLGYKHSEKTKKNISLLHTGRIVSNETRLKLSISRIGKPSNNLGKTFNKETRLKMSNAKNRIILDLQSGVFYYGITSVAFVFNINKSTLTSKLNGIMKNDTSFIYV